MSATHKNILIYGAGAIGRGYIPWVFSPDRFVLSYVERDEKLRTEMSRAGKFKTFKTAGDHYEELEVHIGKCFAPGEEKDFLKTADAVVTAVGPRNILAIADALRGTKMPVICCENDPAAAETLRQVSGNNNVVFAIPDVITSNTASEQIRAKDSLGIITEDGKCFIDDRAREVGGECSYIPEEELKKQWTAKLYLHNTPHCIAAYLGYFVGAQYIHEAMQHPGVREVVVGAMREMQKVLEAVSTLDKEFIAWYADKEIARFSNTLLFDPINRVAREPFRKLAPSERLIGAAQLALSAGVFPVYIGKGIMAAFFYDNANDPDANIHHLVSALSPRDFLHIVMGLDSHSALHRTLLKSWDENQSFLSTLRP